MRDTLVEINGVLKLLTETEYCRLIRSEEKFVLVGKIDHRINKNRITAVQGNLILKELEQNMKYFNNIPFGEFYNNFKTIILKNLK